RSCDYVSASAAMQLRTRLSSRYDRRLRRYTAFPYTSLFRSLPPYHPKNGQHRGHRTVERLHPSSQARKNRRRRYHPAPYNAEYRSEEHTSELQSREKLVCRLLLETKKILNGSASPNRTRPKN